MINLLEITIAIFIIILFFVILFIIIAMWEQIKIGYEIFIEWFKEWSKK